METLYDKVKLVLEKHHQKHLLMYYDKLDEEGKEKLLNQILDIDFNLMEDLYNNIGKLEESDKKIEPIEYLYKYGIDTNDFEKYKNLGENELREGKLAVITMAGGQGTRLRTQWAKRNIYFKCETRSKIPISNFM